MWSDWWSRSTAAKIYNTVVRSIHRHRNENVQWQRQARNTQFSMFQVLVMFAIVTACTFHCRANWQSITYCIPVFVWTFGNQIGNSYGILCIKAFELIVSSFCVYLSSATIYTKNHCQFTYNRLLKAHFFLCYLFCSYLMMKHEHERHMIAIFVGLIDGSGQIYCIWGDPPTQC